MAKLQDVAKLSGVSIASVSRILNEDATFKTTQTTKDKVFQAAKELNYTLNVRNKKNLNKTPKYTFGLIQMYNPEMLTQDPYYSIIESSIELLQVDYGFTISKIVNNQDSTFFNPSQAELDGIFAIGEFSTREILAIKEICTNIVFVDSAPSSEHYGVTPNFHRGICESINCFLENGHKKIGFIGEEYILGGQNCCTYESRRIYFESCLRPINLYNPDYMIFTKTNISSGYEDTKAFLENNNDVPTAFFVSSDSCATGVIRAIIEAGYKIPQDISLIAFNNTILSESALVPLTSVAVSSNEMASIAVKNMIELINKTGFPVKTSIQCRLVHRSSVQTLN